MHTCTCIHTYTHTYTHTYKHTHLCTRAHIHTDFLQSIIILALIIMTAILEDIKNPNDLVMINQ